MALNNLSTTARNAACDGVVDRIDIGSTNPQGRIKIYTSAFGTLLATLSMSNPAFGSAAVGVATASAITNNTASNSGTAAVFRVVDRDDATVFEGTVGTSGADLNFNTVAWTSGDNISITSVTVTMPAS